MQITLTSERHSSNYYVEHTERKLAYNISQKFENSSYRFPGKSAEDIGEYFKTSEIDAVYYKADENVQLQFLYILFDEEAKRLYCEGVFPNAPKYETAKTTITARYNNLTTHNLISSVCK